MRNTYTEHNMMCTVRYKYGLKNLNYRYFQLRSLIRIMSWWQMRIIQTARIQLSHENRADNINLILASRTIGTLSEITLQGEIVLNAPVSVVI